MTTTLRPQPRSSGEAPAVAAGPGTGIDEARPHHIVRLPILILYPYSRCDCRCQMCDIWRTEQRDALDPAVVAAAVGNWRDLGVRRVVFSGGEPLLHPRLWDIAAPLVEAGIGITLLTTGLQLARQAGSAARYIDDVVVSLDGPPAVHDAIRRVPRAFARLAGGIAAVRAARADIAISARCTVQRANCGYLRATVRAARDIGLGGISFLAADVSSEAFNRPGGWPAARREAVAPAIGDLPRLRAELDGLYAENAADFASGFIAETPAKLERRLFDYFAALAGAGELPPVTCNAPWVSAVVTSDGTVHPCFFHAAIGHWSGGPLADTLNAPPGLDFRRNLDVATNPICRQCVCSLNLSEPML